MPLTSCQEVDSKQVDNTLSIVYNTSMVLEVIQAMEARMNEKLFTVSEVATKLGKSRQTIYNWIEAGHFPGSFEVGSGDGTITLIPASDVEVYRQKEAKKLVDRLNKLGFRCNIKPA